MSAAWVFWIAVGFIGYVYAGYPLLITAIAATRRRPTWRPAPLPKVTLIIAAYNEEAEIGAKLDAVQGLDYPAELLQVIVAADGSTDRSAEIVRARAGEVELVHRPAREGKMAAIGRAATWATGDILVFSDANNRFDVSAIRELVAPFAEPRVAMTVGYKTVTGDDGLGHSEGAYWRYESHIRRMETRLGCTAGVNGEIWAIRRELFRTAPPGVINDDQWTSHQLIMEGHDVVFCPEAVSRETVSASAADERERRTRMVAGQYQIFGRLHRALPWRRPVVTWMLLSHKVFRPLVPFAMIAAAIAAPLAAVTAPASGGFLALGGGWGVAAAGGQAMFYALALAGRRLQRLAALTYVPRFLLDSNIAAVTGLWRHLTGSQTAMWDRVTRRTS